MYQTFLAIPAFTVPLHVGKLLKVIPLSMGNIQNFKKSRVFAATRPGNCLPGTVPKSKGLVP